MMWVSCEKFSACRYVLRGKVQPGDERTGVQAELVDARSAKPVWTKKFDTSLAQIANVPREIAEQIVVQIKGTLTTEEKAAIAQTPTHDLEAYELYLHARSLTRYFSAFPANVDENRPKAIELLEKAIARDPNFALAYAFLSETQADTNWAEDVTPEQMAKAKATAEMAVRVGPQVPEAHLVLGSSSIRCRIKKGAAATITSETKSADWKNGARLSVSRRTMLRFWPSWRRRRATAELEWA